MSDIVLSHKSIVDAQFKMNFLVDWTQMNQLEDGKSHLSLAPYGESKIGVVKTTLCGWLNPALEILKVWGK